MSETAQVPADTPQVLLEHHLKALRLPTFLREYDKVARQCAAEDVDYPRYLPRMRELELLDRDRRVQSDAFAKRSSRWSRASTASTSSPSPH